MIICQRLITRKMRTCGACNRGIKVKVKKTNLYNAIKSEDSEY